MKFLVFIEIHVSPKCIQSVSTILFAFDIRKSIIDPNSIDPTGWSLESHNNCIDYKENFLVQPERQLETAPTQWAQNKTPSTLSQTFIYAWHTHTQTHSTCILIFGTHRSTALFLLGEPIISFLSFISFGSASWINLLLILCFNAINWQIEFIFINRHHQQVYKNGKIYKKKYKNKTSNVNDFMCKCDCIVDIKSL